jgi:hypothetical protein
MRNMKAILLILATSFVITGLFLQSPVIAQDFILFDFVTGTDDLRGDHDFWGAPDDDVDLEVLLSNGREPLKFPKVNNGDNWGKGSENIVLCDQRNGLPEGLTFDDIIGVRLTITTKGGLRRDNWNLDRFSVQLRLGDQYRLAFIESGVPLVRFTHDKPDHLFPFPSLPSIVLRVQFVTGSDDLRGGDDNLDLIALLDGEGQIRFSNVNGYQSWDEDKEHVVYRNLPGLLNPSDIVGVALETTTKGGENSNDKWNLNRISARTLLTNYPPDKHWEDSKNPLHLFTYKDNAYYFYFP